MPQNASRAPFKRLERVIGELLRPETRIGRAANIKSTGNRHHIMKRRNATLMHRKRRRVDGVRMQHDIHILAVLQNIAVKPPFRRGTMPSRKRSVKIHFHNIGGLHLVIGQARRRDQHTAIDTVRDIARRALIEAAAVHFQTCINDTVTEFLVAHVSRPC